MYVHVAMQVAIHAHVVISRLELAIHVAIVIHIYSVYIATCSSYCNIANNYLITIQVVAI